MDTGILILIIILSVLCGIWLLFFILAAIVDRIGFGKRYEKNPLLKYFTAEDFNLNAKPVTVPFKKTKLGGYIYTKNGVEKREKLIIFCHGMGAGQAEYTTEIAYFCNQGYTVLALDNMGCTLSGGKNIKGMYSGAEAAIAAVDFARSDRELKELKPYLVGHSWGGYSALCASDKRGVAGVVAISAPDSPIITIASAAANFIPKIFAFHLVPFLTLVTLFKYGAKGVTSAARCAKENGTPTLLIHGDKDKVVDKSLAVYFRAEGYNITKYLSEGKRHNPYNTVEAENKLAELSAGFKNFKNMTESERKTFTENFDFKAATEEDKTVMQEIVNFIEK